MNIAREQLQGLTSQEVEDKLKIYGYNELNEREDSWFKRLFLDFGDLFHG